MQQKPPRKPSNINHRPSIRDVFWCDYPEDAQLPEFWKRRPVIVISKSHNHLKGTVVVLPCTTLDQTGNEWAVKVDLGSCKESWAICDQISTFAVSRLHNVTLDMKKRVDKEDFNRVLEALCKRLPLRT